MWKKQADAVAIGRKQFQRVRHVLAIAEDQRAEGGEGTKAIEADALAGPGAPEVARQRNGAEIDAPLRRQVVKDPGLFCIGAQQRGGCPVPPAVSGETVRDVAQGTQREVAGIRDAARYVVRLGIDD
ncbi:hypothetical protein D3C86_1578680 [compost metagenome]